LRDQADATILLPKRRDLHFQVQTVHPGRQTARPEGSAWSNCRHPVTPG